MPSDGSDVAGGQGFSVQQFRNPAAPGVLLSTAEISDMLVIVGFIYGVYPSQGATERQ